MWHFDWESWRKMNSLSYIFQIRFINRINSMKRFINVNHSINSFKLNFSPFECTSKLENAFGRFFLFAKSVMESIVLWNHSNKFVPNKTALINYHCRSCCVEKLSDFPKNIIILAWSLKIHFVIRQIYLAFCWNYLCLIYSQMWNVLLFPHNSMESRQHT